MDVVYHDEIPDLADAVAPEYPCKHCGAELTYRGKGRKPVECTPRNGGNAECIAKNYRARTADVGTRGPRNATALASQATEALCTINSLIAAGAMLGGFVNTAAAIAEREQDFRNQVMIAFTADPALARKIAGIGGKSGMGALMLAYVTFGAAVGSTAYAEFNEKRAHNDVDSGT